MQAKLGTGCCCDRRHWLCLTIGCFIAAQPLEAKAVVHGETDGGRISRHIYGHFAEHLGRCIYDGIWVGPDSEVPNTRGMRTT